MKLFGATAIILAVITGFFWFYTIWSNYRDYGSVLKRAYTASTATESLDYLKEFKAALINGGYDTGSTAFIFNTAGTDLSKKMRNLDSAIIRMTALAEMEKAGIHDMSYQTGMAEMIDEMSGENGIIAQYGSGILVYKKVYPLAFICILFFIVGYILFSIHEY